MNVKKYFNLENLILNSPDFQFSNTDFRSLNFEFQVLGFLPDFGVDMSALTSLLEAVLVLSVLLDLSKYFPKPNLRLS